MLRVTVTESVNASPNQVWDVLSDFGNVQNFHPMVQRSPVLSKNNRGKGALRRCEFYDNTSIVEEVIEWNEGRGLKVALSEMNAMPLKCAVVDMRIAAIDSGDSEVTFEMDYQVKYGPIGWLMGVFMMRPMMNKMLKKIIKGLEHRARGGESVAENWAPAA